MSIEHVEAPVRRRLLWVGEPDVNAVARRLNELRFSMELGAASELSNTEILVELAGVVLSQAENRPLDVSRWLRAIHGILDQGILVFVLVKSAGYQSVVNALLNLRVPAVWPTPKPEDGELDVYNGESVGPHSETGAPPFPYVRVYYSDSPAEQEFAERDIIYTLVRHAPEVIPQGSSGPGFVIHGPGKDLLFESHKRLLRRSFSDSDDLYVRPIGDGRSGALVFLGHARLRLGARRPSPFFIKLGTRNQILRESLNYGEHVQAYVPFQLAPRLLTKRCFLGAKHGVLVGDFVEDSEGLDHCSRNSRATPVLSALFERSLRGWHYQKRIGQAELGIVLRSHLRGRVPRSRLVRAREFGATLAPDELKRRLRQVPTGQYWLGTVHGDLHAANIQVRSGDAILIDFLAMRDAAPLLMDPSALEVSLLVRVPVNGHCFRREDWVRVVDRLFRKEAFDSVPEACDPREPLAWLAMCIRQVRLHALALQIQPGQYAHVLAFRLFQASTKDPNTDDDEDFRRAYAYWLVQRLSEMSW